MMFVLRSEPGIFSATLVTGFATGFGTFRCHGSMLKLFGSACVVCARAGAQGSDSAAVSTRILISFPLPEGSIRGAAEIQRIPARFLPESRIRAPGTGV